MSDAVPDDRRARRSRRVLAEALWQLIQQSDWADISVQMICDRADVARSTFYAHFQTKLDLLDEVFAEGKAQLADHARDGGLDGTLLWLVERNRGLYVKAGQVLASMNHILPREYVDTLAACQDHMPVVPFAMFRELLKPHCGQSPEVDEET